MDEAQQRLYTSFKGSVADKQLEATIEAQKRAAGRAEETKEKPDVARLKPSTRNYPDLKTTGPAMEEIKEQTETEAENESQSAAYNQQAKDQKDKPIQD